MDKVKFYLVLEKRLGDYNIIYLDRLDICNAQILSDIASIDSFTAKFTENEIRESIKRSNIVPIDYLDGKLKIVSDHKHNLEVITKDIFDYIRTVQLNNEDFSRDLKNKLFGLYRKIVMNMFKDEGFIKGMLDRFKNALNNKNKLEIFHIIEEIPYQKSREMYLLIYNESLREKEINLRNLKKNKDVA